MTLLHEYFRLRDQRAFQLLLGVQVHNEPPTNSVNARRGSSREGELLSRQSKLKTLASAAVNAKDELGRTVLHLACDSVETVDFVIMLLHHPEIDVNAADNESRWTPLHRAMYHANIPVALLLLQRSEINPTIKDFDDCTPLDLYNSTLSATAPNAVPRHTLPLRAELLTWGVNKNATLGIGHSGDRLHPGRVSIPLEDSATDLREKFIDLRFTPVRARQVQMGKLHTAIITSEQNGNLRLCGLGSGGRLGSTQHLQHDLNPMPQFRAKVTAVALGQDHTLALLDSGKVFSWGLNRFSQLGYVVEASVDSGTSNNCADEVIQFVPRKIPTLPKHIVIGVAASKNASVCWTHNEVLAWGAHNGQFCFDRAVQSSPRVVSQVTESCHSISLSENAMICLLVSNDILCLWNNCHFRLNFPSPWTSYNVKVDIAKVTSCDETFVFLSTFGDIYTLSAPNTPSDEEDRGITSLEPQRVLILKKQCSEIQVRTNDHPTYLPTSPQDVALGQDASIIFCTASGHVFVRSRSEKHFRRVPHIQRVVRVCANSTGAYGALRDEYAPSPIRLEGNTFVEDLAQIRPWTTMYLGLERELKELATPRFDSMDKPEGEERARLEEDINGIKLLCRILAAEKAARLPSAGVNYPLKGKHAKLPHGADFLVVASQEDVAFPVHKLVLAVRSDILRTLLSCPLSADTTLKDPKSNITIHLLPPSSSDPSAVLGRIAISNCHPLSILIILQYLYTDQVYCLWDHRVLFNVQKHLGEVRALSPSPKSSIDGIMIDLIVLVRLLELEELMLVLATPAKRLPRPTVENDWRKVWEGVWMHIRDDPGNRLGGKPSSTSGLSHLLNDPLAPDVILDLADRQVFVHSTLLRARTDLFKSFFDDEVWTRKRREEEGQRGRTMVRVDMRHMRWHVVRFVMMFLCWGAGGEVYDVLEFVNSVEDVLAFMFEVVSVANELLLDRLLLHCSCIILKFLSVQTACYILSESTHFHLPQLITRAQDFIAVNLEIFLEARILDNLHPSLTVQLAKRIRRLQEDEMPLTVSGRLIEVAMAMNEEWAEKRGKEIEKEREWEMEWLLEAERWKIREMNGSTKGKGDKEIGPQSRRNGGKESAIPCVYKCSGRRRAV